MKTTESLQVSICRILNENLQLDMPRPGSAKIKVATEVIELMQEIHNQSVIEELQDFLDWLDNNDFINGLSYMDNRVTVDKYLKSKL